MHCGSAHCFVRPTWLLGSSVWVCGGCGACGWGSLLVRTVAIGLSTIWSTWCCNRKLASPFYPGKRVCALLWGLLVYPALEALVLCGVPGVGVTLSSGLLQAAHALMYVSVTAERSKL